MLNERIPQMLEQFLFNTTKSSENYFKKNSVDFVNPFKRRKISEYFISYLYECTKDLERDPSEIKDIILELRKFKDEEIASFDSYDIKSLSNVFAFSFVGNSLLELIVSDGIIFEKEKKVSFLDLKNYKSKLDEELCHLMGQELEVEFNEKYGKRLLFRDILYKKGEFFIEISSEDLSKNYSIVANNIKLD